MVLGLYILNIFRARIGEVLELCPPLYYTKVSEIELRTLGLSLVVNRQRANDALRAGAQI